MTTAPKLLECGHTAIRYGRDPETGDRRCFECCADIDRADMIATGRATLCLVANRDYEAELAAIRSSPDPIIRRGYDLGGQSTIPTRWSITNWPASLVFSPTRVRKGAHNIARHRHDAWFVGPDGCIWHGVQYGDNTQIIHCKRTKA